MFADREPPTMPDATPYESVSASTPSQVVLVEDDRSLAEMIADFLRAKGWSPVVEHSGRMAVARIIALKPEAVILDVNLPACDGFEICRRVRERYDGPILMLTARSAEDDEVRGLSSGADDYLTKPLRPQALLARLAGHRRRQAAKTDRGRPPLLIGEMAIDPGQRSVVFGGLPVELSAAEFDLLVLLAERAGSFVSRADLSQALLGLPYDSRDRTIDLRVSRLRKKLGDRSAGPEVILSVRGAGYQCVREPRRS